MFWDLVRRQLGVVSRTQLRHSGLADAWLEHRLRTGEFERILPGVFCHRGAIRTPEQFLMATHLWMEGRGSLASVTAARLWRLDRVPDEGIVRVRGRVARSPHQRIVTVRATVPEAHTRSLGLLTVTSPARTLCDLAADVGAARLQSAIESAFRMQLCTAEDLWTIIDDRGSRGWKGRRVLVDWLEARGDGPALESELEVRVWRAVDGAGIPTPVRQHPVTIHGVTYRLDLAWPERRVAVECEGRAFHGLGDAFEPDRVRRGALAAEGWIVVPVTWTEITRHADRFLGVLRSALCT